MVRLVIMHRMKNCYRFAALRTFIAVPARRRGRVDLVLIAFLLTTLGSVPLFGETMTGTTGASAPLENHQPTLVTRYIIAVVGNYPDSAGSDLSEQQALAPRTTPYLGEIKAVAFNFAPRGWALCEGQTLPLAQNQALFSLLGTSFGGNGSTTFQLPDLRGRVPMGVGQGFGLPNYLLGQQSGAANPSLSVANLPSHTHTVPGSSNTLAAGSGTALDNRQPALGIQFLITASGEMMMAAFNVEPTGWTHCNGRVLPVAGHGYAFGNIGTVYGGDGGLSSFAVPDTRGRVIIGDDNTTSWPIGKTYGSNDLVLGLSDIPAHTHTLSSGTTGSAGGAGNTANNYQPSLVFRELICLVGSFPSTDNGTAVPYIGEMRLIAGASADNLMSGWVSPYGQLLSINQNQALFSLIGTSYGGNGQNTFALPDLRARLDAAVDNQNLLLGYIVGQPAMLINLSQLAAHAHSLLTLSILGLQHSADGSVILTLQGPVGTSCQVDKSDALNGWSSLGQVNFSTTTQTISDPNPSHLTKRFYYAHTP